MCIPEFRFTTPQYVGIIMLLWANAALLLAIPFNIKSHYRLYNRKSRKIITILYWRCWLVTAEGARALSLVVNTKQKAVSLLFVQYL